MARYKKDSHGYYHTSVALPNGRRKHISAKTIAELEKRKAEAAIKPPDCTTKLRDYALRWFSTYQVTKAYKTREMYAHIIDGYICDPEIGIGQVPMGDLRPMIIQEFLLRVRNSGNGSNSMRRTCEQVIVTLKQIEKAAIRDGVIMNQYTYGVSLEREARLEKRALTQDEEAAIYLCSLPYREKAAIMILYGCGLRRGELLALRRGDIDLEARTISVRRGVVYMGNNPLVQPTTKTASGIRKVPVPKSVMPAIKDYLGKLGDIGDGEYIFPGKDEENPVTLCAWRHMWSRIIKAMQEAGAPCEGLTPHCLRHNYATRCYYSDLTTHMAAKLMGHADTEMIEHVYAHLREEREDAAEKIDQAFPEILSMDGSEAAPLRLVK